MVQVGWVFGPGREIADENSVNVTYPSVGNYTANATALDSWGDTAELPFGTVARSNSVPTLSVRATVSTLRGLAPLTVNFSANASGGTGAPYTFNWVFGDGTHTPEASAQHTYTVVGNYSVSLTVSDSGNAPTQENWTIEVTANATSAPGNRHGNGRFPYGRYRRGRCSFRSRSARGRAGVGPAAVAAAPYPLTTPRGTNRATRRVSPAPSATRTTSSTSL